MAKFYVKWSLNPLATPTDREEMVKAWLQGLELVKADMKTGKIIDFGACPDGTGGYAIREEETAEALYAALLKWVPLVSFDAKPVMTVDQTIESIKKAVAAAK